MRNTLAKALRFCILPLLLLTVCCNNHAADEITTTFWKVIKNPEPPGTMPHEAVVIVESNLRQLKMLFIPPSKAEGGIIYIEYQWINEKGGAVDTQWTKNGESAPSYKKPYNKTENADPGDIEKTWTAALNSILSDANTIFKHRAIDP